MAGNQKMTFWSFINNYSIEIPIIQRDYAQGRKGKEVLRRTFLSNLRDVYTGDRKEKLVLDFVYGSESKLVLSPLDGQQRLTTLWLIHWYVALRSGNLTETVCKILGKFSYETRISSREFCENLCVPENFKGFDGRKITEFIESRTWFYTSWGQDPTIQAMLRMLSGTRNEDGEPAMDGIEQIFGNIDANACWHMMTGDSCPVVFYYMPLNEFNLTDDLYLKMNARGKQLTNFENFKAELCRYIQNDKNLSLDLKDPKSGIGIKLDSDWTNIFWEHRSPENKIDGIYYAFMNRFFLTELVMKKEDGKHILKYGKDTESNNNTVELKNESYRHLIDPENMSEERPFSTLDPYKFYNGTIPADTLRRLMTILDNYHEFIVRGNGHMPVCKWDDGFHFIPKYEKDRPTSLTQVQRVVFYAVCRYFAEGGGDQKSLDRWMRVVRNIVSAYGKDGRPVIRTTQAMVEAMDIIESIPDSHDVYVSLKSMKIPDEKTTAKKRLAQEKVKAQKILSGDSRTDGRDWESVIIEAENYKFFKGSADFLYYDGKRDLDWDRFDARYDNAKKLFKEGGSNVGMTEFAKFLGRDKFYRSWSAGCLNFNPDDDQWRYILTKGLEPEGDVSWHKEVDCLLLGGKAPAPCNDLNDVIDILSVLGDKRLSFLHDWDGCNHVLTNYSQRRSGAQYGVIFEVGGTRNDILQSLEQSGGIVVNPHGADPKRCVTGNKTYYRGLYSVIVYNGKRFAYCGDNTICLLNDAGGEKYKTDSGEKLDFKVESGFTPQEIKSRMDELIAGATPAVASLMCVRMYYGGETPHKKSYR